MTQDLPMAGGTPVSPAANVKLSIEDGAPEGMGHDTLLGAVEALLFISDEPVSPSRLATVLEIGDEEASSLLHELSAQYRETARGVQLLEVAEGWRLYSHPAYDEVIRRYVLSWDARKLSQAAFEALAVIVYGQPVTRQVVNGIRGVNSEGVIASLVDKGLVREVGRDNAPGTPILYGTTTAFLEKFGLASLRDLPPLEDFAPDEKTRLLIRDRLSSVVTDEGSPGEESDAAGDVQGAPDFNLAGGVPPTWEEGVDASGSSSDG